MSNYPDYPPPDGVRRCPICGTQCGISDAYCHGCGYKLVRRASSPPQMQFAPPPRSYSQPLPRYERKFSVAARFIKLITSPREAMSDIALSPDYTGAIFIAAADIIITILALSMALQKLQFTGSHASQLVAAVSSILMLTIFLIPIIFGIRWLVKSWLVKEMCGSNAWDFSTAASVTGYAYIGSTLLSIVSVIIAWIFIPPVVIDTSNLELAVILMEQQNAALAAYQFTITLPLALIGVLWKSYLGGLGAHEGTRRVCSFEFGMAIFVVLGLIGLAIDFLM